MNRPNCPQFLGFGFTGGTRPKRRIAPEPLPRCKQKLRELTPRTRGMSAQRMVGEVANYLRGWIGDLGFCQTPSVRRDLDSWLRRRLRAVACVAGSNESAAGPGSQSCAYTDCLWIRQP